jgi:hypothetical protein
MVAGERPDRIVSGPSVEAIGEPIRVRRRALAVGCWARLGSVGSNPLPASGGVRIDAQGAIESVAVFASEWPFSLAGARVSILWGDPVGRSGGGGRAV